MAMDLDIHALPRLASWPFNSLPNVTRSSPAAILVTWLAPPLRSQGSDEEELPETEMG
jgi:hypothetical protein